MQVTGCCVGSVRKVGRSAVLQELKRSLLPICSRLNFELDLAIVGIRLSQGDVLIIDEYKNYLQTLLPSDEVRNLAMSISGVLTLPPIFPRGLPWRPVDQGKNVDPANTISWQCEDGVGFGHCCDVLSALLKVNPIIPRMAFLDPYSLCLIQGQTQIPPQAVFRTITCLSSYGC